MKLLCCLVVIMAAAVSCRRDAIETSAPGTTSAARSNVVSKLDEKGRPSETLVYGTNGLVKHRTLYVTDDGGRILTARTEDHLGKLKWTEQYAYGEAGSQQPVEIRRLRVDGQMISIRFSRSSDGIERRIVTAPDGRLIPEDEQATFLEEPQP